MRLEAAVEGRDGRKWPLSSAMFWTWSSQLSTSTALASPEDISKPRTRHNCCHASYCHRPFAPVSTRSVQEQITPPVYDNYGVIKYYTSQTVKGSATAALAFKMHKPKSLESSQNS